MNELSTLSLGVPQAATVTLAVLLVVPLTFLARPSRATLLWSLGFLTAALGIYAGLSAELASVEWLRRASLGVTFGAVPLLWSGMRAWRRVAALPWIAALFGAGAAVTLAVLPDDAYAFGFRVAFLLTSVFAALTARELRRIPERRLDTVIPFTVLSILFAALGLAVLLGALLAPDTTAEFTLVRAVNAVGVIAYVVCALLAVVSLVQSRRPGGARAAEGFPAVTAERLRRAAARRETGWAVLAVQLDDPHDLAEVYGGDRFGRVLDRFDDAAERTLPANADIGGRGTGRLLVLLRDGETGLRRHVRELLREVELDDTPGHLARLSASVGWVDVRPGEDPDPAELRAQAEEAAAVAARAGGNRWHRVAR